MPGTILSTTHSTLMCNRLLTLSLSHFTACACRRPPRYSVRNRAPFAGVRADCSQHRNQLHRRSSRLRCGAASNSGGQSAGLPPPPPDPDAAPDAVAEWARAIFLSEVAQPDDRINLAKVGLLISLEEEAAAQAHRAANDPTTLLPDLLILRRQLARYTEGCLCAGPTLQQLPLSAT
jgi:hypothetical protein